MINEERTWIVVENENEKEYAQKIRENTLNKYPYEHIDIDLEDFLEYLRFDYVQIGKVGDNDWYELGGYIRLRYRTYKICGFKAETTIETALLKKFIKELTKNIVHKRYAKVRIYFCKNLPVWFDVDGYIGIIAPLKEEEEYYGE